MVSNDIYAVLQKVLPTKNRWDSAHFLLRARDGYSSSEHFAFFPLWPCLLWVVHYPWLGVVAANALFVASVHVFRRLSSVKQEKKRLYDYTGKCVCVWGGA